MSTLWPRSNSIEWDANGDRATGAKAYFYEAGTSTPRPVYQEAALSTPHTHPVVADGNGRWPAIFLEFGSYKETITTSGATTLWSTDNIPNPEPFDDTFELDEDAQYNTGDYIFTGANASRAGAVRCNGKTIGNAASGATERANADTAALFAYRWNNYANGQAAVSTGRGASAVADYAANKTITVPDHRGAGLVGFDDMGNTAASLLTAAPVVSGSAILAGSIIGANTHTLTTAESAAHTHTGTTATEAAHTHTGTTAAGGAFTPAGTNSTSAVTISGQGGGVVIVSPGNVNIPLEAGNFVGGTLTGTAAAQTFTGTAVAAHTHTFTTAAGSAHSHTFTSASTGGGGAHNNVGRSIPITVLMKL